LVERRVSGQIGLFDPAIGDWVSTFHAKIKRSDLAALPGQSLVYIVGCGAWSHLAIIDRLAKSTTSSPPPSSSPSSTTTNMSKGDSGSTIDKNEEDKKSMTNALNEYLWGNYLNTSIRLYNVVDGSLTHLPLVYPSISGRSIVMKNLATSIWLSYDCRILYYWSHQTKEEKRAIATTRNLSVARPLPTTIATPTSRGHQQQSKGDKGILFDNPPESTLQLIAVRLSTMTYISGDERDAPRAARASNLFNEREQAILRYVDPSAANQSYQGQPLMAKLKRGLELIHQQQQTIMEQGVRRIPRRNDNDNDDDDDNEEVDEWKKAEAFITAGITIPLGPFHPASSINTGESSPISPILSCTFDQLMSCAGNEAARACLLYMIHEVTPSPENRNLQSHACVVLASSIDRRRHLLSIRHPHEPHNTTTSRPIGSGPRLYLVDLWNWQWSRVQLPDTRTITNEGGLWTPQVWGWFVPSTNTNATVGALPSWQ
jgi:hypothetical protein